MLIMICRVDVGPREQPGTLGCRVDAVRATATVLTKMRHQGIEPYNRALPSKMLPKITRHFACSAVVDPRLPAGTGYRPRLAYVQVVVRTGSTLGRFDIFVPNSP